MGPSNHNADVSRSLAYIILGEKLHLYHVAGIALVASGIAIMMLFKQKLPDRSTAPES